MLRESLASRSLLHRRARTAKVWVIEIVVFLAELILVLNSGKDVRQNTVSSVYYRRGLRFILISGMRNNCTTEFRDVLLVAFLSAVAVFLSPFAAAEAPQRGVRPAESANKLVEEAVRNELNSQDHDQSLWKYRELQTKDGKLQLFDVVQTKFGEIQRLIALGGRPLDTVERSGEDRRIRTMLQDRRQWQGKQKSRASDADEERKLLAMLPAAFLYQYEGNEREVIRLRFNANPNFHPESREATVFHHMEGIMLVNAKQKRLAGIDGRLLTEVKFGGGLLGHLNREAPSR